MPGQLVPPVQTTRPRRPIRIFSADRLLSSGHGYTPAKLRQAVHNFNSYQRTGATGWTRPKAAYIPPPAEIGIGHEDDQAVARAILARTDWPSSGYPTKLWVDGPDLWAELDGVPVEIASMVNAGQFSEVSAEFYPDYVTPDGRHWGTVLRRISLLGSAPPRCKSLQPGGRLPEFVFSEPPRDGRRGQNVVAVFSEAPFMTADEARAILEKCGVTIPDGVPDAFVIMMAGKIKELLPPDPDTANGGNPPPGGDNIGAMTPDQFAERMGRVIDARLAPVLKRIESHESRTGDALKRSERQEVETFAEGPAAKKLYVFEKNKADPNYIVPRLLDLPPASRAKEMAAILARPDLKIHSFSELVEEPDAGTGERHGKIVGGGLDTPTPERMKQLRGYSKIGQAIDEAKARTAAGLAK